MIRSELREFPVTVYAKFSPKYGIARFDSTESAHAFTPTGDCWRIWEVHDRIAAREGRTRSAERVEAHL